MTVQKTIATAGVGAAIVAGSLLAVTAVNAQTISSDKQAERVSELAERFSLDEADVKAFFEEKKAEHQAEREEERAEFVAGLVADGTLTQVQADELTALREATKAEVDALRESGAEREEIKTLMEEKKAEIEAWAEAQGIDLDSIRPEKDEGHRGRGHHGPRGDFENQTPEDTTDSES